MSSVDTAQVLRELGITAADQVAQAPNDFYQHVFRFSALAAGATVDVNIQNDRGRLFIVDQIFGYASNDAAAGTGTTITALTNANGTSDGTIADVTATPTQTLINNNFRDVSDKINEIITALGTNQQYPAGHSLAFDPMPAVTALGRLDVQFYSQRGDWQDGWLPWPSTVGTARHPFMPLFKPVAGSGHIIGVRVKNNSSVTVSGAINMSGRRMQIRM
jgi:hypothetical protein